MPLSPIADVPVLEAVAIGEKKSEGASIPVAIQCSPQASTELAEYVVKFYGSLPLGVRGLARELYAALLGQSLGLDIPPAAIVNIDPELSQTTSDPEISAKLAASPGLNFGSRTIEMGAMTFGYIPRGMVQAAADIFAFDMLIQNLDRSYQKPNMLQTANRLIAIDHEDKTFLCAADDILGIRPAEKPWEEGGMKVYANGHRLYSDLKGKQQGFDEFVEKVGLLSDVTFEAIGSRIPEEWAPVDVQKISDYLREAVTHLAIFHRCLLEVLA